MNSVSQLWGLSFKDEITKLVLRMSAFPGVTHSQSIFWHFSSACLECL